MDSTTTTRNNGLASIAITSENHHHHRLISRTTTFGSPYSSFCPRSGMFFNGRFHEQQPYFLDACFLCKKPLGSNRDIFMYRGNLPFCSVECREEQIEIDETKEKKRNLSKSIKALRKKEEREKSTSPKYPFHSGAVVAA